MPTKTIFSVHNPLVKAASRLRDRRHREAQGKILIDGARELSRALAAGVRLQAVFLCRSLCRAPSTDMGRTCRELVDRLLPGQSQLVEVTPAVFSKLAYGDRAEGVLGVAEMPRAKLAELALPDNPLVAVLEGVEKPGNLGAVLRSADAAGVAAVVSADGRVDLYHPNVIRASLGTIFCLPVCEAPSADVLAWLRNRRMTLYAARSDAAAPYTSANLSGPAALVLGSEATGLSPAWSAPDIQPIRLPMRGAADSLNVSAAAAVLFYEALRQRSATL